MIIIIKDGEFGIIKVLFPEWAEFLFDLSDQKSI